MGSLGSGFFQKTCSLWCFFRVLHLAGFDNSMSRPRCVIRGCVPKKLLVYGSAFTEEFRDSKGFGWSAEEKPPFNWEQLLQKKVLELTLAPS